MLKTLCFIYVYTLHIIYLYKYLLISNYKVGAEVVIILIYCSNLVSLFV